MDFPVCLSLWLHPDTSLVHQVNLFLNDLLSVLSMLHRLAIQVQILRINRLFVEQLVEFSTQIFHPVIPLCTCPVVSQRLDINHSSHICRTSAILLLAHNLAFIIDDERAPTEGIDWRLLFRKQIIRPHVWSHEIHIVVERTSTARCNSFELPPSMKQALMKFRSHYYY